MNNTNKKSHFNIKTARNLIPGMYESTIFLHELFQHKSQKLVKRQFSTHVSSVRICLK